MPDKPWARSASAAGPAQSSGPKPWENDATTVAGDAPSVLAEARGVSERPWERSGITQNGVPSTSQVLPYGTPPAQPYGTSQVTPYGTSQVQPYGGTSMYGSNFGSPFASPYGQGYSPYGSSSTGYGASSMYGGHYSGSMYNRPGGFNSGGMYGSGYGSSYGSGYAGAGYGSPYSGLYGGPGYGGGGMYGAGFGGAPGFSGPAGMGLPGGMQAGGTGGPAGGRTRWQVFMDGIQHLMHFFGRVSFLMDENAHAVHFFVTALLQLLDRASFLWGEVARFVLRLLGYKPAAAKAGPTEQAVPQRPDGQPVRSLEAAWPQQ